MILTNGTGPATFQIQPPAPSTFSVGVVVGKPGLKGDKGDQGDPGPRGPQGLPGIDGTNGINGADGINGIDGADGADGINGAKGEQGDKGDPGPQNLFVQPTDPGMTGPGLWVQTGLGDDGSGITLWIEDGT